MNVLDIPEQLELWFGEGVFCLVVDGVSRLSGQIDQRDALKEKKNLKLQ